MTRRYADRRVAQWRDICEKWFALREVVKVDYIGWPDFLLDREWIAQREAEHLAICDRHIAYCNAMMRFWQQPFWPRVLWRNWPGDYKEPA